LLLLSGTCATHRGLQCLASCFNAGRPRQPFKVSTWVAHQNQPFDLSKVFHCPLQCTFVTVAALVENTQHFIRVSKTTRCNTLVHMRAILHSSALPRCRLVMPTNKVIASSAHQHQVLNMPFGLCRLIQALGQIIFCVNTPKC